MDVSIANETERQRFRSFINNSGKKFQLPKDEIISNKQSSSGGSGGGGSLERPWQHAFSKANDSWQNMNWREARREIFSQSFLGLNKAFQCLRSRLV
jgi:hypothetical protein